MPQCTLPRTTIKEKNVIFISIMLNYVQELTQVHTKKNKKKKNQKS
jgi:hypothetical protein